MLCQDKMMGQRGKLRALAGICHVHEGYFLTQRKSVFRVVRMQFCLSLRFLVTLRPPLHEKFAFLSIIRPRSACMGRLGRQSSTKIKTSAGLEIAFVDMTYPKGWTGSLPLCPLIFSWLCIITLNLHFLNTILYSLCL